MNATGIKKLERKMLEMNISKSELAEKIGVNKSTVYRKIQSNGEDFTVSEANKIVDALELTKDEAISIFFSHIVA